MQLWNTCHKENEVVPACKKSLENLGVNYVDLFLIHWPLAFKVNNILFCFTKMYYDFNETFSFQSGDELTPKDANGKIEFSDTDYLETWKGMEECKRQGLARSIGVSNFNSEQITRLLASAEIKPVNNQVCFCDLDVVCPFSKQSNYFSWRYIFPLSKNYRNC